MVSCRRCCSRDSSSRTTNSEKYQLGAGLLQLGYSYLDVNELRSRSITYAGQLAVRTKFAVRVGVMHGPSAVVVHHVFRPDATLQILEVGSQLPLHASALGKALLAFAPSAVIDNLMSAPLERLTKRTPNAAALRIQLNTIRVAAIATERDEAVLGESSIAAPIFDRAGNAVGAIAVVGDTDRVFPAGRRVGSRRRWSRRHAGCPESSARRGGRSPAERACGRGASAAEGYALVVVQTCGGGSLVAAIRIAGSIRDWFNARDVRRMVRKQEFPDPMLRHYFDLAEYGRDEAALQAIGYMVVGKEVTATHVGVTLPASSNGVTGHLDRRIQRRVASIHVLYARRPEPRSAVSEPVDASTRPQ